MNSRIVCFVLGHKKRISKCPYTLNVYDVCDRCGGTLVIGKWNPDES